MKELQDQVKEAAAVAVSEDEVLQQVYTHNGSSEVSIGTVSYTHLTLPTIGLV